MIGKVLAAATGVVAAGLTWGLVEARCFALRELQVPLLEAGSAPISILHISDIHLMPYDRAKIAWVSRLQELEPDLVINTGDNISSAASLSPLLDALGGLLDVPGAFVFGSNDFTSPSFRNPLVYLLRGSSRDGSPVVHSQDLPWRDLRDAFQDRGWVDLNNASADLEIAGRKIALRGTGDAHLDRDKYSLVAGPSDPSADLNIGVTHAPYLRVLDAMTADGMDMIFAGHTHGGQVCLPFKGALITNCDIDTERVKGLHTHTCGARTSLLHVSAGIGSSPYAPYRTFCRPEATLLTLTARDL